jgi:ubiquinone/menaquinone biosynthesis C-methylase UbiE
MEIHDQPLDDVTRYLETYKHETIESKEPEFQRIFRYIQKFKKVGPEHRILEIGTGTGGVPILCKMKGLNCRGLEISRQLINHAREWGRRLGVEPDIQLGNIETDEIGDAEFDVIIGSSVFEHVEHWQEGLGKVYRALKPGGIFFFESTNKFSFVSGEFGFPLYGWLSDSMRYSMRIRAQGPDIMKLGIDFNQFTYVGLRRAFRRAGFSEVHDLIDVISGDERTRGLKAAVAATCRALPPVRHSFLLFYPATTFICRK